MNFITDLLPVIYRKKVYNAILIIINKYFKIIRYILYISEINASELNKQLIKEIFLKFNRLKFIISNREFTFIFKY